MADGSAGEQFQRGVVVDTPVACEQAAVPVARVLAEADIGDDEQVRVRLLDRARRELDDAFVVPRARSLGVLLLGNPKENDAGNPQRCELGTLVEQLGDRQA
jgi:hypothetical protein